jgi:hypothetical protein
MILHSEIGGIVDTIFGTGQDNQSGPIGNREIVAFY